MHPRYLGFQVDWPVFIRVPFYTGNRVWKRGEHFTWLELGLDAEKVSVLYSSGTIYHNEELEIKCQVGDRLSEFSAKELETIVSLLNSLVEARASSKREFRIKKCKSSKIVVKQRGLMRSFLRNNDWVSEEYYSIRDRVLEEQKPKGPIENDLELCRD